MRKDQKENARALRKTATKQENRLWYAFLREYPVRFRRQAVFDRYIVDFYCPKAHLAVELDGSQHYDEDAMQYDARRTAFLQEAFQIEVLRFTNLEIEKNFEGVCIVIDRAVRRKMASPPMEGRCQRS